MRPQYVEEHSKEYIRGVIALPKLIATTEIMMARRRAIFCAAKNPLGRAFIISGVDDVWQEQAATRILPFCVNGVHKRPAHPS